MMNNNVYMDFAKQLFLEYQKSYKDENIVFSPYSVLALLSIAVLATGGETQQEILDALTPELTDQELSDLVHVYGSKLSDGKGVTSLDAIITSMQIFPTISGAFRSTFKNKYGGELFASKDLVRDVNSWVDKKTKGMIKNIADDSMNMMLFALLNAVCFQAEWKVKYKESDIYENQEFHNSDDSISKVTMLFSPENSYVENEFFEGFVKPYRNDYSFLALLPKKNRSKDFLRRALMESNLVDLVKEQKDQKLWAIIPEFSCDCDKDLKDMLRDMGIKHIFEPNADFSPITPENVLMDCIKHKARIEVDRRGTKASSVTMGVVCAGAPPESPKEIIFDRPFVYAIVHNDTGMPLFEGIVNHINK